MKKMKKRILTLVLLATMILLLTGCTGDEQIDSFLDCLKIQKDIDAKTKIKLNKERNKIKISSNKTCYLDLEGEVQLEDNSIEDFTLLDIEIVAGDTIKIPVEMIDSNYDKNVEILNVSIRQGPYIMQFLWSKIILMVILLCMGIVLTIIRFPIGLSSLIIISILEIFIFIFV